MVNKSYQNFLVCNECLSKLGYYVNFLKLIFMTDTCYLCASAEVFFYDMKRQAVINICSLHSIETGQNQTMSYITFLLVHSLGYYELC